MAVRHGRLTAIHVSLFSPGFSNVNRFARVWPTAPKLGCITRALFCYGVHFFG